MKLGKKLMVVAMAVATLSMVGCALNQDGEGAIRGKKVDFDNSYVFTKEKDGQIEVIHADGENDTKSGWETSKNTKYFYRGIKQLATKHYDSICTITITPNDFDLNNMSHESSKKSNGVVGFFVGGNEITNWNNTSTGALNCILVGVRYNKTDNKIESYISKYGNVSFSDLNYTEEDNLVDNGGTKVVPYKDNLADHIAFEKDYTNNWDKLSQNPETFLDSEGNYKIVVKSTAKDDGSYYFEYFKESDLTNKGKIADGATPVMKLEIPFGASPDKSGYTERTQTNLGWYANIYPGQHLTASWKFTDTNGNVIPVPAAELD